MFLDISEPVIREAFIEEIQRSAEIAKLETPYQKLVGEYPVITEMKLFLVTASYRIHIHNLWLCAFHADFPMTRHELEIFVQYAERSQIEKAKVPFSCFMKG